jgi:hypothetical protein
MSALHNPTRTPTSVRKSVSGVSGRQRASVPFIVDEPVDRNQERPCYCTDYHRDVGLNLTYCPRHGREPDPELWNHAAQTSPIGDQDIAGAGSRSRPRGLRNCVSTRLRRAICRPRAQHGRPHRQECCASASPTAFGRP